MSGIDNNARGPDGLQRFSGRILRIGPVLASRIDRGRHAEILPRFLFAREAARRYNAPVESFQALRPPPTLRRRLRRTTHPNPCVRPKPPGSAPTDIPAGWVVPLRVAA